MLPITKKKDLFTVSNSHLTISSVGNFLINNLTLQETLTLPKQRNRIIQFAVIDFGRIENNNENNLFVINSLRKAQIDVGVFFDAPESINNFDNGYLVVCNDKITLWISLDLVLEFKKGDGLIVLPEIGIVIVDFKYGKNEDIIKNAKKHGVAILGRICWSKLSIEDKSKLDWIIGLNDKDIGLVNGKFLRYSIFNMSKDSQLFIVEFRKTVRSTAGLKLAKLKSTVAFSAVSGILNGNYKGFDSRRFVKTLTSKKLRGDFSMELYILNKLISNDLSSVYSRFNALWSGSRREPYLGFVIPDRVVGSFKTLLEHTINKQYRNLGCPLNIDYKLIPDSEFKELLKLDEKTGIRFLKKRFKFYSKSSAANLDNFQLKDIVFAIKNWIIDLWKRIKQGKSNAIWHFQMVLRRLILSVNNYKDLLVAKTFFLLKDPKLADANDVRMIMISPTILKIYEVLIYNEVNSEISKIFGQRGKEYQLGARQGGSTFAAMERARRLQSETGADGLLILDIRKGYESVWLEKLEKAVKELTNARIRWLLSNWVLLVYNLDILVSGVKIKKKRGIPMGLILSPLMFILYVDFLLQYFDKQFITMYIDDLAIVIMEKVIIYDSFQYVKDLVKKLSAGGLVLNWKKAKFITYNAVLVARMNRHFPEVQCGPDAKFLGRLLLFINGVLKGDEDKLFIDMDPEHLKVLPSGTPLFVKQLIFSGALDGKIKFAGYIFSFSRNDVKNRIFVRAKKFFDSSVNLKFESIALLLVNYIRLFVDYQEIKKWDLLDKKDIQDGKSIMDDRWDDRLNAVVNWCSFKEYGETFWELFAQNLEIDDLNVLGFNFWEKWKKITNNIWKKFLFTVIQLDKPTCLKDEIKAESAIAWFIECRFVKKFAILMDAAWLKINEVDEWVWYVLEGLDSILDNLGVNAELLIIGESVNEVFNEERKITLIRDVLDKVSFLWYKCQIKSGSDYLDRIGKKWYENKENFNKMKKKDLRKLLDSIKEILIISDMCYRNNNMDRSSIAAVLLHINVLRNYRRDLVEKYLEVWSIFDFKEYKDEFNLGSIDIDINVDKY